jgi:hypothetical protein
MNNPSQFFRSRADLFPPEFLWGSGTLLASYDQDPDQEPSPAQIPVLAVTDRPHTAPLRRPVA